MPETYLDDRQYAALVEMLTPPVLRGEAEDQIKRELGERLNIWPASLQKKHRHLRMIEDEKKTVERNGERFTFRIKRNKRLIRVVGNGDEQSTGRSTNATTETLVINDLIRAILARGKVAPD